ncbi:JAB domain-containing protein [Sphingobacteriales bacterium UPWRP_1]|nr:hypothetical protein BVG80_05465 [Sphingobacteriales bacterium TSM_CSM]PSJ75905.1 JAB domain-containing protein [Sphingobacteriales bacterium UPWRP_1]
MDDSGYKKMGIKTWAEEDRPREKLLLKGRQALTDAELLAILIGSGNNKESAVDLCKRILKEAATNDLNELAKLDLHDLMKFKGIGEAKAISIIAALELGRRRRAAEAGVKPQITGSRDVFELLQPRIGDLPHEEFWVLYLNRANRVTHQESISAGGVTGTVADIKIIFKKALNQLASGIIIAHNHPSGNLKPSQADIDLTRKVREGGKTLEISVLDHLIITTTGYFSFADEGLL